MEVQALTKHARISSKKAREVARVLQGKPVSEAIDLLKYIPRKAAELILKTLRSALANAENNHNIYEESLKVKIVDIGQGPSLKRFRPAARGMAHPFKKHTSHIKVILYSTDNEK